jgi:hypothetical protein
MHEGRLPKPKGKLTPNVSLALRAYRKAWCADVTPRRRRHYNMILAGLLEGLTVQEAAEYYAGVQQLRRDHD